MLLLSPACSSAAPSAAHGGSLVAALADYAGSYPKQAQGQPTTGYGCWPMPLPALVFSQRGRNVAYPVEPSPMTVFPACPAMQAFYVPDDECPGVCMTVRSALRESAPCLDNSLQATYIFKKKGVYRLCVRSPACPAPPCPWVKTNVTVTVAGHAAPPGSPPSVPSPLASPAPELPSPPPPLPPRHEVPGEGGGSGRGLGNSGGGDGSGSGRGGVSGRGCGAGGSGCGAVGREAPGPPADPPYFVEAPQQQRNRTTGGVGCSADDVMPGSPNLVRTMPRLP